MARQLAVFALVFITVFGFASATDVSTAGAKTKAGGASNAAVSGGSPTTNDPLPLSPMASSSGSQLSSSDSPLSSASSPLSPDGATITDAATAGAGAFKLSAVVVVAALAGFFAL